ncbi:MAG: sensor domain-containing diguanylate cyclase [Chlorobia bacterium]|nr:sensor domain-containing diguanylate cyclase [Fimbriimonadaceae bacterium]
MPDNSIHELMTLLREYGVRTIDDRAGDGKTGFPVTVPLGDGQSIILDLPAPSPLNCLDPSQLGVAILDPNGKVRRTWGLANQLNLFRSNQPLVDSAIGSLLEASYQGSHGSLYLDGYRYFSAGLPNADSTDAFLLVVNAQEERNAKRQASKSWRIANALKRLGKILTMNQQVEHISVAAAHEIASATELAAVLVWTVDPHDNFLRLAASVGANRAGTNVLSKLAVEGGSSCVAELVATTRNSFFTQDVDDHMMTCELEAKFCYLRPGGASVHPLVISDRLLGVLELIGREEDPYFEEHQELFQTVAEHFALALNAAIIFEDFEKLATHDALTGIANHRHLQEFLHQRVLEAARTGQELGVIMLDVDHFRSFNEEEGHDAGDEVLRLVADSMKACVRPYDLAARYGGEEFTVVMPGSSEQTTLAVAERIRQRVESLAYMTRSGRDRHITVSLGCACYPNRGVDAADILKAADVALFEAKRTGRNKVVTFTGQTAFEGRRDDLNLPALLAWLPEQDRAESEDLYGRCLHDVVALSTELNLTAMQTAILQALVRVIPTYRRVKDQDAEMMERMLAADEFRLLVPSLNALEDRYEEKGNLTPLLARALAAILAVIEGQGKPFADDPNRYDPEIMAMVLQRKRAA